jgi:hypothetical protein
MQSKYDFITVGTVKPMAKPDKYFLDMLQNKKFFLDNNFLYLCQRFASKIFQLGPKL